MKEQAAVIEVVHESVTHGQLARATRARHRDLIEN